MTIAIIAPHADDETLGCGGSILKFKKVNERVCIIQVTDLDKESTKYKHRQNQIRKVLEAYDIPSSDYFNLGYGPATLTSGSVSGLISNISKIFQNIKPNVVYLPSAADAHSDHFFTFNAGIACCKTFRYQFVESVFVYETLSETDFGLDPSKARFSPNWYEEITEELTIKQSILELYDDEIGDHPFPRNSTAVEALAILRGTQANVKFAESFQLLKRINTSR